jgi:hypothetical protein
LVFFPVDSQSNNNNSDGLTAQNWMHLSA